MTDDSQDSSTSVRAAGQVVDQAVDQSTGGVGEHVDHPALGQAEEPVALPPGVPSTGNAAVDAVLAAVVAVAEEPVGAHVPVFERAHEQLRAALDSSEA